MADLEAFIGKEGQLKMAVEETRNPDETTSDGKILIVYTVLIRFVPLLVLWQQPSSPLTMNVVWMSGIIQEQEELIRRVLKRKISCLQDEGHSS